MTHLTNFELFLLLSALKVAVVLVITLLGVAYTVLLERKLLARIQNRWGPSRVGPFGLLQPLVDGGRWRCRRRLERNSGACNPSPCDRR